MIRLELPSHLELLLELIYSKLNPDRESVLLAKLLTGVLDKQACVSSQCTTLTDVQYQLLSGNIDGAVEIARSKHMYDVAYYLLS